MAGRCVGTVPLHSSFFRHIAKNAEGVGMAERIVVLA